MLKNWIFLDIDNCLYNGLAPDGSFSVYKKSMRQADESWAVSLTNDLEGLRAYRAEYAEKVGMDQSLLDFISLKIGKSYGIAELARHRNGPAGYQPEKFLRIDSELADCLAKLSKSGYGLAAVTDNPAGARVLRALGITPAIIPEKFVFDSGRIGSLKNPFFFKKVLEIIGIAPGAAVMYGDSMASDITPAAKAGIAGHLAPNRDALLAHLTALLS